MNEIEKQMKINIVYSAIVLVLVAIMCGALFSCNTEKKALKPYIKVATDTDTTFKAKKIELISRVCAVNFPIEVKTIIKDSIRTKIVKVQDIKLINDLKAKLAKGCPTLNIDSIYENLPLDTLYVEKWKVKETTVKDTIAIYNTVKVLDEVKAKEIEILHQQIKIANKWKLYFFLLLGFVILWRVGIMYLKTKFSLPKIF